MRLNPHVAQAARAKRFFPVGVPGLFRQYNAPDFVETAKTIGLPRYAKQAVDQQFARWVVLHVQSNPFAALHPAAGADQGQAHLMTASQGAVDVTFAAFGIDVVYTPAGGGAGPAAGDRLASGPDRRLRRHPHPRRDRDLRGPGE